MKIKITQFTGHGAVFANLTPDSVHESVPAPADQQHLKDEMWVMGVGEPVRVLDHEYEIEN